MPASKKDIRILFVKKFTAVDSTERDALMKQLEEEKFAKKILVENENKLRLAYNLVAAELNIVKEELGHLRASRIRPQEDLSFNNLKFMRSNTFDSNTQCRLLDFDQHLQTFIVGVSRKVGVGRVHGIAKISLLDPDRIDHLNSLHNQTIKSFTCSPHGDGMLLSTSFDRTLKLTLMNSNSTILSYPLEANGWSCCFDLIDRNMVYAGLANETICIFDVRNTAGPIRIIPPDSSRALPIHSLSVTAREEGGRMFSCSTIQSPFVIETLPDGEICRRNDISVTSKGTCSSFICNSPSQTWMASVRGNKTEYSIGSISNEWKPRRTWSYDTPQKSMTRPSILGCNEYLITLCPNGPSAVINAFSNTFELLEERLLHTNGSSSISDVILAGVNKSVFAGLLTERQFSLFSL